MPRNGRDPKAPAPPSVQPPGTDGKPSDGAFQSMDQIANWVRFADTKATILFAGVSVVLTMTMTNGDAIVASTQRGDVELVLVSALAALTALLLLWTVHWLYQSLRVRSTSTGDLNRFAWPTMATASASELRTHADAVDVSVDAWAQVATLSMIAAEKFSAQVHAVRGFFGLILSAATLVALAVTLSGLDEPPANEPTTQHPAGSTPTATARPTKSN